MGFESKGKVRRERSNSAPSRIPLDTSGRQELLGPCVETSNRVDPKLLQMFEVLERKEDAKRDAERWAANTYAGDVNHAQETSRPSGDRGNTLLRDMLEIHTDLSENAARSAAEGWAAGTSAVDANQGQEPRQGFFSRLWGGIKNIGKSLWSGIKSISKSIWGGIKSAGRLLSGDTSDRLSPGYRLLYTIGKGMIEGNEYVDNYSEEDIKNRARNLLRDWYPQMSEEDVGKWADSTYAALINSWDSCRNAANTVDFGKLEREYLRKWEKVARRYEVKPTKHLKGENRKKFLYRLVYAVGIKLARDEVDVLNTSEENEAKIDNISVGCLTLLRMSNNVDLSDDEKNSLLNDCKAKLQLAWGYRKPDGNPNFDSTKTLLETWYDAVNRR